MGAAEITYGTSWCTARLLIGHVSRRASLLLLLGMSELQRVGFRRLQLALAAVVIGLAGTHVPMNR